MANVKKIQMLSLFHHVVATTVLSSCFDHTILQ